ncbi:MAG: ATP-binding protein [Thermoleophilia bacterium]
MIEEMSTSYHMLHLVVPAKAEYLSLLRMVVAAVAGQVGFSEDNIADIKVALSEASTNVVRHAYAQVSPPAERVIVINCYKESYGLLIKVEDRGTGIPLPPPASEGLGLGIMSSLMDDVAVETGSSGTTVLLQKSATVSRR